MKIYQGIDILSKNRIMKVYSKFGETFLKKILTENEISDINKIKSLETKIQKVASRFASKEAVSKALGTGFSNGLKFKHFEVFYDHFGRPEIVISDFVRKKFFKSGEKLNAVLTISNEKDLTIALVTLVST